MPQIPWPSRGTPVALPWVQMAVLGACFVSGGLARAAVVDIKPYAQYDWVSAHNPFLAPDPNSGALLLVRPDVDDKLSTWLAGFNLKRDTGATSTYLAGEGRKVVYSTYDIYNHTEYAATLGHKRGADGQSQFGIEFGAARKFTEFFTLAADTPIAYQTSHYGRVFGVLRLATRDVLDASYDRTYRRLPIAGAADFNTTENSLHLGYGRMLGNSVTVGVRAMGITGTYVGNGTTAHYKQLTPELYFNYDRAGALQVNAGAGAAHRTQDGSTGMKANVGNVSVRYAVGPKTALRLAWLRQVSGYYVVGGSQTTTSYTAGIDWRPTGKFSLLLDGGRTHGLFEFPGTTSSHIDDFDTGGLTATWDARPWLALSVYGLVQKRTSNVVDYRFDANSVGISVRVRRP
jgi:hypothetical protein